MTFIPPVRDQLIALRFSAGLDELAAHDRFAEAGPDLVEAIAEGIGQLAAGEWAVLNRLGDQQGAKLENGKVILPSGFADAYRAYVEAGWNAISGEPAHGGQGLPYSLACCVMETLAAANMAFSLLPMLTVGAIEALTHHGSPEQKGLYLPKLISGEWSGTMNLTEAQAGSDVGALRTTATPIADGPHAGKFSIRGTKIFITWGEHDLTGNIVHLVLARTPGAPAGTRGISLFLVPRNHLNADGTAGPRNDLRALSLEHKLGIHASPTCVMEYGENGQCVGELIGRENEGLRYMFTMMNSARINVGAQGVAIAEAAFRKAAAYARERVQSARAGAADRTPVAIVEHPDVRRMLLRMRALTEGARGLLYYTAGQVDRGTLGDASASARAELLVPLIKAWGTDVGCEVASLGVQIHGGMGFIEETGAAQFFRDARIAPIYEGTNGIQAADLVTRKLGMEAGGVLIGLMDEIARDSGGRPQLETLARQCRTGGEWMRDTTSLDDRLAASVPFLTMCAVAVAGWQLKRQAEGAERDQNPAARAKAVVARHFLDSIVPEASGLASQVSTGAANLYALDAETLTS